MARAPAWLHGIKCVRLGSERQPGVSLERLLAAVAVVIQQLLANVDVVLGNEDETRRVAQHDHLRHAVWGHTAVVQKAAVASCLLCCVNAILLPFVFEIIHVAPLAGV